jgi:molybdopterin-guanine dinucleotide biosynthesis protein
MTALKTVLSRHNPTTIAIIGLAKNTGKTTTLNACIQTVPNTSMIALTSIGLDGEAIDQVTFLPKPKIHVKPGMIIATAKDTLKDTPIEYDTLKQTTIATALGDIVIIRIKSQGNLVIAGPSTNQDLNRCVTLLKTLSDIVLIDGAFNRKTFASIAHLDGLILATGASFHPVMEDTIKQTQAIVESFTFPKTSYDVTAVNDTTPKLYKNAKRKKHPIGYILPQKTLYIKGAITPSIIDNFIKHNYKNYTLIITEATKLLIPYTYFTYLHKLRLTVEVLHPIPLLCVTINPFSPKGHNYDKNAFFTAMQDAITIPVINVLEKE